MPDLARNRRDREVYDAAELPLLDGWHANEFECHVCGVEMVPVACDGRRRYKVSPYFRANGPHGADCDADGLRNMVRNGVVRPVRNEAGHPVGWPSALRLVERRDQVAPQGQPACDVRDRHAGGGRGQGERRERHDYTASSLKRIAEHYCLFPRHRDRRLTIPGCDGRTYGECFVKLGNTREARLLPAKIHFSPMRFKVPVIDGDVVTFTVNAVLWVFGEGQRKPRPGAHYTVRVDMAGWSAWRRNHFLDELARAVEQQKANVDQKAEVSVCVFFLGRQDERNPMVFLVDDARLVCFLTVAGEP
ncbi:hypothetical protein GAY33_12030 [Azospirillum brasilense]|uniref:hypothetical protein n=1 Tax=Azospirillum argentinense TaxID=2970906 RepID=UPI001909CF6B|nr:hypothetical protein [Azospirillum argentinense]MBK3799953.1 hypothetical protein [Azospirillum argentinense]